MVRALKYIQGTSICSHVCSWITTNKEENTHTLSQLHDCSGMPWQAHPKTTTHAYSSSGAIEDKYTDQSCILLQYAIMRFEVVTHSSSPSPSFPMPMWGRCFVRNASIQPGLALPPLTILSPTRRSWCHLIIFLWSSALLFPGTPISKPSPSLFYQHILLLFSIPAYTTSSYFPVLYWILTPPSLSFYFFHSLSFPLLNLYIHLNIHILITSNFFSCAFFTAHVSALYIIASLTTNFATPPWRSAWLFGHTEPPISINDITSKVLVTEQEKETMMRTWWIPHLTTTRVTLQNVSEKHDEHNIEVSQWPIAAYR